MMHRSASLIWIFLILMVFGLLTTEPVWGAPAEDVRQLSSSLDPHLRCLSGKRDAFKFSVQVKYRASADADPQLVTVNFSQRAPESLELEIKHDQYWVRLLRRPDRTALVLPLHKTAMVGSGPVSGPDTLASRRLLDHLVGDESLVATYLPLLTGGDSELLSLMLTSLLNPQYDKSTNTWSHQEEYSLRFDDAQSTVFFNSPLVSVELQLDETLLEDISPIHLEGFAVTEIERAELERHLVRGIRRACAVAAPAPQLTHPAKLDRQVPHGELRWLGDHRSVLLQGSPAEIGAAHGELLKSEIERCIDSVLYGFGTLQTIRSGLWFRHELEEAYERLAPHIPERHKTEMAALAQAVGCDPQLAQIINVFPELFHCSGFAVFGNATVDGKLYHGRVLDYMTTIGLQDSATTFVIDAEGQIPFVTVGYAGFIGSVSGMNQQGISLGEMGGGGDGRWDGVPMATLMRRALEECTTLSEVQDLWRTSPRTCEYFYVFADGKTNQAVGVAATPETIDFIQPGQSHPRLGDGIEDAVVLSVGSRLETLRARVSERYGQIDAEVAKWLMSRPVAMSSNLHNVLFVPADGLVYVANADHRRPAADNNYTRIDLSEMLATMLGEAFQRVSNGQNGASTPAD